ncbi:hypothetical protein [Paenibacillus sp. JJ-223]|uniref:hypothetical protein n=1 Tax=Paenibacillus sp. JJ-223 TaxID=2905647 RepID=UPI001F16061C|nr:hypothetical protein [Paenibacillus sp. JJ-223]CAH1191198.1 hypothetical protein PAECIP111890_00346 [Paenibacillus sp. JJ-223]
MTKYNKSCEDTYIKLWEDIRELDEKEIVKIVESIKRQTHSKLKREEKYREFKNYLKTPLPYIAVIMGITIPSAILVIFLWTSLKLEY